MTVIPDAGRRFVQPRPPLAFSETFSAVASPRGRGGDLNPSLWATARLTPDALASPVTNHTRHATIPVCRSGISGTSKYPPDDLLICDGTSTLPGTLMQGCVIQNYGNQSFMARQPFDFAGRTGIIYFDVDAVCLGALDTYIEIDLSEEPTPAPTYLIADNDETGPLAANSLLISFSQSIGSGTNVGIGTVHVYAAFVKTLISASFELTSTALPTTLQDKLNRCEIRLTSTDLQIWMSDYSSDGVTFGTLRKIWQGTLTMPFTRGYVHFGARNHASVKYGFDATHVYHWDNVGFDGPVLTAPRAYEIPDNTTTGTSTDNTELDYPYSYENLGYQVSDGSGRAEGIWSPTANISPFSIASVSLTNATAAYLALNLFVQTITHTPDVTWGLKYKFNGGTWRTRLLTAAECAALIANPGMNGYLCLLITVSLADLTTGTNTLDFSGVNLPMDFPPIVTNIDLLVAL
jgi:hypothetical protein